MEDQGGGGDKPNKTPITGVHWSADWAFLHVSWGCIVTSNIMNKK